jgi:uncharacterized protein
MPSPHRASAAAARPLDDADLAALQALLESVPAPLEPLDVSALDGYLAGVALQRPAPAPKQWLRTVTDVDGRALPAGYDATRLHALVQRRHAELAAAIARRQWFDPWIFELDTAASPSQAVLGWVAGFATAMERFPALLERGGGATLEPLALLYRHLDPGDLEDADELLAEIDTLEPPADLAEAVEDLVRATLLLADVSYPRVSAAAPRAAARVRRR